MEMLERFLRREKEAQNIYVKKPVKLALAYLFERHKFVNAGVVDQNVDFAERFLRFSKRPLDVCLLRDVPLGGDCYSVALTELFTFRRLDQPRFPDCYPVKVVLRS